MDNRNQPRSRKDSVTEKERRGMQQGYPVRDDATLSFDRPINRPTGPREVPQSMRQGKIPVRENASTGRTIPVMNRNGQPVRPVPTEIPETRPIPFHDTELPKDTAPKEIPADVSAIEETASSVIEETPENTPISDVTEEPAETELPEEPASDTEPVETEPVAEEAAESEPVAEETAESEPVAENAADNEPAAEEAAEVEPVAEKIAEAESAAEEAAEVEQVTEEIAEDEPVQNTEISDEAASDAENTEPVSVVSPVSDEDVPAAKESVPAEQADEVPEAPADEEEQDPDEELLLILHRRRKAQTPEPEAPPAAEELPADVPDETPEKAETANTPAAEPADSGGSGKKLWLLPLVIAILVSLAMMIGIPAFFTSSETVPDFDMTLSYGETLPGTETGILDETSGAGREDSPDTDSQPPETTPAAVKFNVTLDFFDRDPMTVSTSEITLEALLERVNYVILDTDRFSVDLTTLLTEEITITVDTVTYGTASETITIPFEIQTTNVQTIPRGQRNVTQYGKNGSKTITYTTEIVNGVEVSRTVAKEEITAQPVTETCQVGIGGTLVGNDGKTYSYSYYRMVNATYYDIEGLTYLGYEADESVVAVDMDYIPLGTKIYVKNDQFDFGVRVAADTGSMIEGWEVDIWLDDSNPQKDDFAYIGYVKNMIIYYLD